MACARAQREALPLPSQSPGPLLRSERSWSLRLGPALPQVAQRRRQPSPCRGQPPHGPALNVPRDALQPACAFRWGATETRGAEEVPPLYLLLMRAAKGAPPVYLLLLGRVEEAC